MTVVQDTIFGRIVTGDLVEKWCLDLIRTWIGTYLSEVERQSGLTAGDTQRPRSFTTSPSVDAWPEDQMPRVMVVSVGVAEKPVRHGGGHYSVRWQMGVAACCSARTQAESHRMAMLYVAALRTLFLQRPSLDGNANGVDWQDERYDDLPFIDTRTLEIGQAVFTVQVEDAVWAEGGPATPDVPLDPDTLPWPPWQQVQSTEIEIDNVPLTEEVDDAPSGR